MLILKWMDFCILYFWELRHKLRQKCLQQCFCRKGETNLCNCVMAVLSKKITFCSIVMFLHGGVQSCGGSFHINFELYYIKIVSVARDEAANYRSTYGSPIPLKVSCQSIYFRIKDSKSLNQNAIKLG